MAVEVRIPPVLRKHTNGAAAVPASGSTMAAILESLENSHPGLRASITDPSGQLHRFINVYRNGEDIRYLSSLETAIADGDVVAILPAVAGGR
ncbi:MAG: MoaD/ThiS family protein [Chloroflexi bacterium]|nr:MoaD/ThiS family protein [Chloroflexota bacterium]